MCVEENRLEDARALEAAGLEVFAFDIDGVDDVEPQLGALADLLEVPQPVTSVDSEPASVDRHAFVPIWRRPWMSLQSGTYGSDLLRRIGIGNIFADEGSRYPEVTLAQASAHDPDLVIAPSEPYPFSERHRRELEVVAPTVFVDGQDLFWWGVRTPAALGPPPRAAGSRLTRGREPWRLVSCAYAWNAWLSRSSSSLPSPSLL